MNYSSFQRQCGRSIPSPWLTIRRGPRYLSGETRCTKGTAARLLSHSVTEQQPRLVNPRLAGLSLLHFAQIICLHAKFVEQRLRVLQIGGVEALGEPVVNL